MSTTTKLNIGKIPISKGEYQEGTAYQRLNQVTMLGSTYQSKIDDNTSAPAQMGADGAVENINTDKWLCIAVGNVSAARKVVYNNETSGLEAGNVQEAIDEVGSKVSDLSSKTEKIGTERIYDTKRSVQFFADNNEDVLHEINEDFANFQNLKSNGKEVLTEHQDVSNFATKSEVETKQDKIKNVESVKDEKDISNIELRADDDNVACVIEVEVVDKSEPEVTFQDEERKENYVMIGSYGIKAKGFYDLNGNPISKKTYIVDKNGGGDYTSLTDCVIEATKTMDSLVYVHEGTYDLYDEMIAHYGADFFTSQINSNNIGEGGIGRGLLLKNNIHLIFSAKAKVIFNTNISSNPLVREQFSPFNAGEYGFTLENANIECNYCRYCMHDERGTSKDSYVNKYINCKMKTGNSGDMFSLKPIGGGLGKAGFITLTNCHFNHGITWHNCIKDDSESTIVVNNCLFDEGTFGLHHYGESSKITCAYVSNCVIADDLDSSYETSNHNTPKNTKIVAWNNTKIKEIISNE